MEQAEPEQAYAMVQWIRRRKLETRRDYCLPGDVEAFISEFRLTPGNNDAAQAIPEMWNRIT